MIRRLVTMALLAALAVGAAVMTAASPGSGGARTYRVDAIFDNAGFLIPGQDVKVAGAKVGSVVGVRVTPDRRARVEMEVQEGFAPFRSDADCIIRPQSLIGEKFVNCSPGSVKGRPLRAEGGHPPTVPVSNTHSPVDLDLVFDALRMPVRQRLAVVVNELGTGLAGRPRELNAAILRANPALQQSRRVLAILDADRARLGRLIDGSDRVLGALTSRREDIRGFLDRADRVAQTVSSRRGDMAAAIDRLPPLLAQLEPTARELGGVAREGLPLARSLRPTAKPLYDLLGDFKPLSDAVGPVLPRLDKVARTARRAVTGLRPSVQLLQPITRELVPITRQGADFTESLRDKGAIEHILEYLNVGTASLSRFDRYSHMLPAYLIFSRCNLYAKEPVDGCDAHYGSAKRAAAAKAPKADARTQALDYLLGK